MSKTLKKLIYIINKIFIVNFVGNGKLQISKIYIEVVLVQTLYKKY